MRKILFILILGFFQSGWAFGQDSEDIEQIKQIIPTFSNEISDLNLTDEKDYEKLKSLVHKHIHVRYVAARTLGPVHWKKLNKEEQEIFTSTYLDYMLVKFIPNIKVFLSTGKLELYKVRKSSSEYILDYFYKTTEKEQDEERIRWILRKDSRDNRNKITNMSVADFVLVTSDLQLIRILDKDGAEALINAVKDQTRMILEETAI